MIILQSHLAESLKNQVPVPSLFQPAVRVQANRLCSLSPYFFIYKWRGGSMKSQVLSSLLWGLVENYFFLCILITINLHSFVSV